MKFGRLAFDVCILSGRNRTLLRKNSTAFTLVCEHLKKPSPVENPAYREICAIFRFLSAKGMKAAEIRREISEVHGENIMSSGMIRKWDRTFKYGRANVHDLERILIIKDLVQEVDE